jgi:hypothetical protein
MVFSIIILGVFQGSLFKNYTTTTYYADIDTLEEIDQSGLPVAMPAWRFVKADSDLMRRLLNKTIPKSEDSIDFVAYQRNIAMCEVKSYAQFFMKTRYVDNDGLPLLHIVDECLATFLLGTVMPKDSAFFDSFQQCHHPSDRSWFDSQMEQRYRCQFDSRENDQSEQKSSYNQTV